MLADGGSAADAALAAAITLTLVEPVSNGINSPVVVQQLLRPHRHVIV
jgi:gamma-glutamyltranspeptidase